MPSHFPFIKTQRRFILILLFCLGYSVAFANDNNPREKMSSIDYDMLIQATEWFDQGHYNLALDVYDALLAKYPGDRTVTYEKALTLYMMNKLEEASLLFESNIKQGNAQAGDYSMLGNCYDRMGDSQKALEIYQQGFEKYPDNSIFLTETGNVFLNHDIYDEALKYYQFGMRLEPMRPQNYYRAANVEFQHGEPIWGLIYAETEIFLALSNVDRHLEMSKEMINAYRTHCKIDGDSVIARLFSTPEISISGSGGDDMMLNCGQILSLCYETSLKDMLKNKKTIDFKSLESLIELRRGMVETYFRATNNLYGNSMYLLEYQKEVMDAGHWGAYNWFLFSKALPEEAEIYLNSHEKEIKAFSDWYNDHSFTLDKDKTVCRTTVRQTRKLNIMDALMITGNLTIGD